MTKTVNRRPISVILLASILVFTGIGGLYGGALLIAASDGSKLQMSTDILLVNSPFHSFLLPGLILLLFNGILPLLIAWALFVKPPWQWPELVNLYHKQHWCWTFSLYYGFILIIWINTQQIMLDDYALLQPVFALTGALISILTLFPSVFQYYRKHL